MIKTHCKVKEGNSLPILSSQNQNQKTFMRKVYFICLAACFITANVVCTKPVIDNPASPGNHESSRDVSAAIVNKP